MITKKDFYFAVLLVAINLAAQLGTSYGQSSEVSKQATAQNSMTKTPATEADELSREVVKLYGAKKFDEALPLAKRAIELKQSAVGKESIALTPFLNNLAAVYRALNKNSEAGQVLERLLALYEADLPPDDVKINSVLENQAIVYFMRGDYGKAEKSYLRVAANKESKLGSEHPETISSLNNLAQFYSVRGQYEKAEPLFARVFATAEKNRDDKKSNFFAAITNYTCALRRNNKVAEAEAVATKNISDYYDNVASARKKRKIIAGGVINGKAISKPAPLYPAEAKQGRVQGIVTVQIVVDEKGDVIAACAVKGAKELLAVSENAAYRSKFSPTFLSGEPVVVFGTITYNFKLQ